MCSPYCNTKNLLLPTRRKMVWSAQQSQGAQVTMLASIFKGARKMANADWLLIVKMDLCTLLGQLWLLQSVDSSKQNPHFLSHPKGFLCFTCVPSLVYCAVCACLRPRPPSPHPVFCPDVCANFLEWEGDQGGKGNGKNPQVLSVYLWVKRLGWSIPRAKQ